MYTIIPESFYSDCLGGYCEDLVDLYTAPDKQI
jgi:hypothetical protein